MFKKENEKLTIMTAEKPKEVQKESNAEAENEAMAELQKKMAKSEAELNELTAKSEAQQAELAKAITVIRREVGEFSTLDLVISISS